MLVVFECVVCGWFVVYGIDVVGLVLENGLGFFWLECIKLV